MKILNLDQIKQVLKTIDIISEIEKGFVAYSNGLRTSEDQITIADLTGVAVQDIAIAKAVFEAKSS